MLISIEILLIAVFWMYWAARLIDNFAEEMDKLSWGKCLVL